MRRFSDYFDRLAYAQEVGLGVLRPDSLKKVIAKNLLCTVERAEAEVAEFAPQFLVPRQPAKKYPNHLARVLDDLTQKLGPVPDFYKSVRRVDLIPSACECGSAKLGIARGPQHSSWCPWSKP